MGVVLCKAGFLQGEVAANDLDLFRCGVAFLHGSDGNGSVSLNAVLYCSDRCHRSLARIDGDGVTTATLHGRVWGRGPGHAPHLDVFLGVAAPTASHCLSLGRLLGIREKLLTAG